MADEGIERLARVLAVDSAHAHMWGESWMGWPDPDNDAEVEESIQRGMESARQTAARYAAILAGVDDI